MAVGDFDELIVNVDEKMVFSRQMTWEIQMCFSIFIAMTTSIGVHTL